MPGYQAADGRRLHCDDAGSGRPLVLLHGWACHAGYFAPQLGGLAGAFRVIAPDMRGHHRSHRAGDAPTLAMLAADLQALLATLDGPAPVLVGWSMGALVALELIRRQGPCGIGGLAIVDMTPRVVNDDGWRLGLAGGYGASHAGRAPAAIRGNWPRWVAEFLPAVLARGAPPDHPLLSWIAGEMQGCDPAAMAALWSDLTAADYREDVASLSVPALVVRGEHSQLYGPATAAWLARTIPGAGLATISGAGHAPHLERPEAFNAALAGFAARLA